MCESDKTRVSQFLSTSDVWKLLFLFILSLQLQPCGCTCLCLTASSAFGSVCQDNLALVVLFCCLYACVVFFCFFVFFWMTGWTGLRFGCVSATEVHSLSHKHAERAVGISKRTLTRTRALAGRGKLQREDVQHNSRAGILILGREVLELIDCLVFTLLWEQFKMH